MQMWGNLGGKVLSYLYSYFQGKIEIILISGYKYYSLVSVDQILIFSKWAYYKILKLLVSFTTKGLKRAHVWGY